QDSPPEDTKPLRVQTPEVPEAGVAAWGVEVDRTFGRCCDRPDAEESTELRPMAYPDVHRPCVRLELFAEGASAALSTLTDDFCRPLPQFSTSGAIVLHHSSTGG